MLLARRLICAVLMFCPAAALAQTTQGGETSGFDMFDLDSIGDDSIALPDEPATPVQLEGLEAVEDTDDPCRHLDAEQRKRLTLLCGPSD